MGKNLPVIISEQCTLVLNIVKPHEDLFGLIYSDIKNNLSKTHDDLLITLTEDLDDDNSINPNPNAEIITGSKQRYDKLKQDLYRTKMEKVMKGERETNPNRPNLSLNNLSSLDKENDEISKTIKDNPLSPDRPEGVDYIPTPL